MGLWLGNSVLAGWYVVVIYGLVGVGWGLKVSVSVPLRPGLSAIVLPLVVK